MNSLSVVSYLYLFQSPPSFSSLRHLCLQCCTLILSCHATLFSSLASLCARALPLSVTLCLVMFTFTGTTFSMAYVFICVSSVSYLIKTHKTFFCMAFDPLSCFPPHPKHIFLWSCFELFFLSFLASRVLCNAALCSVVTTSKKLAAMPQVLLASESMKFVTAFLSLLCDVCWF